MKFLKPLCVLIAVSLLLCSRANAQDDVDQFLQESAEDAEKLIGAYVSPLMKSVSLGLNQGWYNTAKPHKIAGVDITLTANLMKIPTDELFYDVAKLNLTKVDLHTTSPDYTANAKLAPTIFGPEREPVFYIKDQNSSNYNERFNGPPGIDLKGNFKMNSMPVPMAHLGFGLPKGTEIKFRYLPELDLGDEGSVKMFGIGIMHDVKQWIPGIKLLPFDLSGFVGHTKLDMNTTLDEPNTRNAKGIFEIRSTTVQGLISKKFSVLTLYGGLGYNIAKSTLALKGEYDLNDDNDYNDLREKDPINLNFAASGPRATAGFRLKLAIFTIHADYTLQKYSCLTAGFGLSVR
jgi:hypothetical protein